jgi:hypothetical protein
MRARCLMLYMDTHLRRASILLVLTWAACSGRAQTPGSEECLENGQFEPTLVDNARGEVTFDCRDATALDLIKSVGRQTRLPIGIVLGKDPDRLSKTKRDYRLFQVDAKSALLDAVTGTGYMISESGEGFILTADDLTSRQGEVSRQKIADFRAGSNTTMVELGSQLTMWLQSEVDHPQGFAASILYSTNEERFALGAVPTLTVQEIAQKIVSLGSKGMWILTTDPVQRSSEWRDKVEVEPYQHYSNQAVRCSTPCRANLPSW